MRHERNAGSRLLFGLQPELREPTGMPANDQMELSRRYAAVREKKGAVGRI